MTWLSWSATEYHARLLSMSWHLTLLFHLCHRTKAVLIEMIVFTHLPLLSDQYRKKHNYELYLFLLFLVDYLLVSLFVFTIAIVLFYYYYPLHHYYYYYYLWYYLHMYFCYFHVDCLVCYSCYCFLLTFLLFK